MLPEENYFVNYTEDGWVFSLCLFIIPILLSLLQGNLTGVYKQPSDRIFFSLLEFELRPLYLLGRHPTTWATLPTLCACLVILEIGFRYLPLGGWSQTAILLISAS
jgi:hypothetical protein